MIHTSSLVVEIEGKRFSLSPEEWENLDCIQIDSHTYHLLENGVSHTITVISADSANRRYTLKIDGQIKEVSTIDSLDLLIEKMGLNSAQAKKQSQLNAPMPGLVTGIKISEGQEVEKGTPLLILEAMKMENVIVAPHHAVISSIKVSVGQAVEKGALLLEFAV